MPLSRLRPVDHINRCTGVCLRPAEQKLQPLSKSWKQGKVSHRCVNAAIGVELSLANAPETTDQNLLASQAQGYDVIDATVIRNRQCPSKACRTIDYCQSPRGCQELWVSFIKVIERCKLASKNRVRVVGGRPGWNQKVWNRQPHDCLIGWC